MSYSVSLRRVFSTLLCLFILSTSYSSSGLFGIKRLFSKTLFFVESVVTGDITECVDNNTDLFNESTCKKRLHANLDLFHGLRYFHYVFRSKEDPSKGLYIVAKTSKTSVMYKLNYKTTVPTYYKEHTETKTYQEVGSDYKTSCKRVKIPQCTPKNDYPPGLEYEGHKCCVCNVNVKGDTPRGNYSCDHKSVASKIGNAMSSSCLEIVQPWYHVYEPSYPPEEFRNVVFNVYKFDSSNGIIPDLKLINESYFDNFKDPVAEEKMKKIRGSDAVTRNKPNFRRIFIDKTVKEENINDFDLKITLLSSASRDGTPAPLIKKYIAVPSYPRTHETVKGSSLHDKCTDPTWDKNLKCPEYMTKEMCNLWRCTLNMRTIEHEAADTTGATCDKIGVSLKTWSNFRRICDTRTGSCIKNQLGWYLKEKQDEAKLPILYGVEPIINIERKQKTKNFKTDGKTTTWFDDNVSHNLHYNHTKDDVTRVKIDAFESTITEIVSDFPGFILSARIENECQVSSEKPCLLKVDVKNMGIKRSEYTVRAKCYSDPSDKTEDKVVAKIEETTKSIQGNEKDTFSIPLDLTGTESIDKGLCDVVLYSGTKQVLDNFSLPINITSPKPKYGLDPKSQIKDIHTAPEKANVVVNPADEILHDKDKTVPEEECTCSKYNVFCLVINFRSCVSSYVKKILMYVGIGFGILLILVLLPVLIPLFVHFIKGLVKLLRMPLKYAQRKNNEKLNMSVATIAPLN